MQESKSYNPAEAAMEETDNVDYRFLFEASPEGILLAASDRAIFDANDAACRSLKQTREEILGTDYEVYWAPSDPSTQQAREEQRREGRYVGELRLLRRDEAPFHAEVSINRYRGKNGEQRVGVIFRDISGHKRSEEAMLHRSDELWRTFMEKALSVFVELDPGHTARHRGPTTEQFVAHSPPSLPLATLALKRLADKNTGGKQSPPRLISTPEAMLELLTPREIQILYLLSRGQSNSQIARSLVISPGTAKLHVHRVITKLEVSDRTQAAIVALRSGIFGFD
jgi:PAS domain S-box-containing protein